MQTDMKDPLQKNKLIQEGKCVKEQKPNKNNSGITHQNKTMFAACLGGTAQQLYLQTGCHFNSDKN